MARPTRKRTEATLAESQTLLSSARSTIAVLQAWHPGSMSLAIVTQQQHAFRGELAAQPVDEPLPLGEPEGAAPGT